MKKQNKITYAFEIDWDISTEDVINSFAERNPQELSKILNIDEKQVSALTENEMKDIVSDKIRHNRIDAGSIVGLPDKIRIPASETEWREEDITNYISEQTGYCFFGYSLMTVRTFIPK